MALTVQQLRAQHPEFDQYGYTDYDIVDWYHAFRTRGGRSDITVADTARELGVDIPDSNFANSWQQAWNDQKSNYAALARAATEDVSDPTRGYTPLQSGVPLPGVETITPQPGFTQFTRDLKAGIRDTRQLMQEGLDLARQDLGQQNQTLSRYNTYPQSWEEMQFGDDQRGLTAYMANLAAQSGPESLSIVGAGMAGGIPAAVGLASAIGTGRMAGIQQEQQGYTDSGAFAAGGAYGLLSLAGPEAAAVTRVTRPGTLANLGSRTRNFAYQGGTGAVIEGAAEVGQEALELAVGGQDPLSPEAMGRYKEAAIGGALLGGPISGAIGATVGPEQQIDLTQTTDFQPPPFPAFSGETTQPVPTGRDFGAEPIVGPPRPARFDPEQIAQAIPVEEITMETVPTEGIDVTEIELPTESIDITPVQDTTTPRLPPRLREVETKPITNAEDTITLENVAQSVTDLIEQTDAKYTNADLDWALRHVVGKTVEDIAAVDTRSPKRQALLEQITRSAPIQEVVSPDPKVPTTGVVVETLPSAEQVAPVPREEKITGAIWKTLTDRQAQVLEIMMDSPGIQPEEISEVLSARTGTKVSRQRVQGVQKALRRKVTKAAEAFGMTPEQLQEVIAVEGAAQRTAAGAPAQPDQTVAELPPEAVATADQSGDANTLQSMGEVASPGASQADISATDTDTTVDPVTGKQITTGYAWLRENDPDSPTMNAEAQKLWTAQKRGQPGIPPYRQLGDEHKRVMIAVARQTRDMSKTDRNAVVAEAMNRILGDFESETYQQKVKDEKAKKVKQAAEAKPTTTRDVSRETSVARAVWESVTDDVDNNWDTLTERQQEIFQFEVENLANKTGLTEASLNRTVREIKKRVTLDGGAYYEGMYHRVGTPETREERIKRLRERDAKKAEIKAAIDREQSHTINGVEQNQRLVELRQQLSDLRRGQYLRGRAPGGSQASQVAGWTQKAREALGSWVKVNIVQSAADVPKRVDGRPHPEDVAGLFADGQVYLVADNIGNKKQALETFTHEVVGHLGLETMLGERGFAQLTAELEQLIAEGDPAVIDALETVRSMYVDANGEYVLNATDEAREVLAHIAQRNPNFGIIRKLAAMLRKALAKIGIGSMAAAELNSLIVDAGRFTRRQNITPVSTGFAYNLSPLEQFHQSWMQEQSKGKWKSSGKYKSLWADTREEFKQGGADAFRSWVAEHRQRVDALNKHLKSVARTGRVKAFMLAKDSEAELYNAHKILKFFTRDNRVIDSKNVTPLAADLVYGEDGQLRAAAIMFHVKMKAGEHEGLIGVFDASPFNTDLMLAPEKDAINIQNNGIVSYNEVLLGAHADLNALRPGQFDYSVDGPSTDNADFNEQWVNSRNNKHFELYEYPRWEDSVETANLKAKNEVTPGSVSPRGGYYVRWTGLRKQPRAINELNKFITRGRYLLDGKVPALVSIRETGANVGKQTFQKSRQVERMYHRRREAAKIRTRDRLAREIKYHWKAFSQRVGPELLNLKGIVDVYGQALPSLRDYYKSVSQMEALQTHLAAEAQAVATKWHTVPDKEKLDALAMDATMDQIHPDVAFTDPKNAHLEKSARTKHARLAARYQALSPEGKEVYQLARDKMRADWDMRGDLYSQVVGMAYADAIQNADTQEAKNDLMKKRDEAIEAHKKKLSEMKGPYFPLMRFGPYIAIWKSPKLQELEAQLEQSEGMVAKALAKEIDEKKKDGSHYIVRAFETEPAMQRFLDEDTHTGWYSQLADPADPKAKDITKLGMDKVKEYLSKNVDSDTRTSIERMLAQLYVGTLPENHALARELRRQGIEGAETDMLRAFATATEKMSFYLSRFKYRDQISERLNDINAEAQAAGEGTTDVSAKKIYQHVLKRYKADLDFKETPIQNFIARLSGLHHLASPAYWMVNATQPWLIGAPYAAARLGGMSKVLPEMRKAFGEAYKLIEQTVTKDGALAPINIDRVGNEAERQMLRYLVDHGRIDINITAELGALAKSGISKMDRLSNLMMWPAHQVETSNRLTLALATYRLARRQGMNYKEAVQLVDDTIVNTQVDYSNINAPYYMKTGVTPGGKLIFQFRKYQQAMVQLLALQSRAWLKGDKQARATLAYLVGSQLAIGGVASTPGIGAIWFVVNMFIDDDDEEGDAETQMRNALTDWVGPDIARLIWKGMPSGVGMDLSKRTGMGDIFAPMPFLRMDGRTGEEMIGNIAMNVAGAWTSIPKGVADSYRFFESGNIWRGLESAVPLKAIRDLSKAARYEVDGLTTRSENIGVSSDGFSAWDIVQRGLGLSPLKEVEYYEVRSAKARTERAINDLRTELLRDYSFARMAGDREAMNEMAEAMAVFNREHPEYRIDGSARRSAYRNRRRYNRVNDQGVAELPGRQKLESLTRFAN